MRNRFGLQLTFEISLKKKKTFEISKISNINFLLTMFSLESSVKETLKHHGLRKRNKASIQDSVIWQNLLLNLKILLVLL
jgi:hypothetical protein